MPELDHNSETHADDDLELAGLDLDGQSGSADPHFGDLGDIEDDLADLGDDLSGEELADPEDPSAPEDTDDNNHETAEDLDPDELRIESTSSVNQRFGSRNRNPERRKSELSMFQDFMTTSISELRAYSTGLQSEAQRIQTLKDQQDREERRQARIAARSQTETFLEKTEGSKGYIAPLSDLSDPEALSALKETFAPISGLRLDHLVATPSTAEEKKETFPHDRHPSSWLHTTEISPWLRIARGLAGLLPEWHDIEKYDIKTGTPVFKRIAITVVPDDQELPDQVDGFIRRDIGPGVIPIGWRKKMQTSGAVYFIGEKSSIVILNNSSIASDTVSMALPTGSRLTHRSTRIAVAIDGGLAALRRQILVNAPMAGRDGIENLVNEKINLLSTDTDASKAVYMKAVGASAWNSSAHSQEQNVSVGISAFNAMNGNGHAQVAAVPEMGFRQIESQVIANQGGQHIPARKNEITNAVATMAALHSERSRSSSSRSNLLKGASGVRSSMSATEGGTILTLTTDISKETLTTTFHVGANGLPTLKDVLISSVDMEPVRLIPQFDQQGEPVNSATLLMATGMSILDNMERLRDFFEEGIGDRRTIINNIETLQSRIEEYPGEITGVPYTVEDLAASASAIRAEIEAELQEHQRAATINVFEPPPANEGNGPQLGM